MKARLLLLATIALVMACGDNRSTSGPTAPDASSKMISDGAHGGNPDFFFLPPMVGDPSKDPNYEVGKFNSTLAPSLTVEICQLQASPVDAAGQPVVTDCVAGPPLKKFPAGSVTLQSPPDGFYQVLWHAGESNLDVTKFYRIKVLAEGSSTPFGVADIDAVSNMKELRNVRTGEVIPLNENSTLPIKFRIEHAGGPALCGTAALCTSTVVTNNSAAGFQVVTVDGGAGAIAGVKFPNGWLPATGPQNVVVTIAQVDLGSTDPVTGAETTPCHLDLPLQQFGGCFRFTTTPQLQPINESGDEFAVPVTVAVCYVLYGTGDAREKFAEMYSSGPNEPPHPLEDASDAGLFAPNARNCSTSTEVIGDAGSNRLTRFAHATWRNMKSGAGRLFGVKTAYAIDLGLGGLTKGFSNVGPALNATIEPINNTHFDVVGGGIVPPIVHPLVRIVGSNHHDGQHQNSIGLAGLPVTWTVAGTGGTILGVGGEGPGVTQLTTNTNFFPIDPESPTSGGGYSAVDWTVPTPTEPGTYTYTLTATGAALGGPVTFTSTVVVPPPANLPDLRVASGFSVGPSDFTPSGGFVLITGAQLSNIGGSYTLPAGVNSIGLNVYVSDDPIITSSDQLIFSSSVDPNSLSASGATLNLPVVAVATIPHLSPGLYYVGIIVDPDNKIAEGVNDGNNYGSSQIVVFDGIDFENYPAGGSACNGQGACDVTNEFASRGVTFSSTTPGLNPSLCRTMHGPAGEGSNYGVSDPANSDCSGWTNSGIVMSFANHPSSVQLQVEVNINSGPQVTGIDATGATVNPEVVLNATYGDASSVFFHRVIFRFISPAGMQTINVAQSSGVHIIDNLIIKP